MHEVTKELCRKKTNTVPMYDWMRFVITNNGVKKIQYTALLAVDYQNN